MSRGSVQVLERCGLTVCGNLSDPIHLGAKLRQFGSLLEVVDGLPVGLVLPPPVVPLLKRQVVNEPADAGISLERRRLSGGRVEAIAVSTADQHITNMSPSDSSFKVGGCDAP